MNDYIKSVDYIIDTRIESLAAMVRQVFQKQQNILSYRLLYFTWLCSM